MNTPLFYLVQTPEVSLTWIGGRTQAAEPDFVWLTSPDGTPVLKVPVACVTPSTKEQTAQRILEEMRAAQLKNYEHTKLTKDTRAAEAGGKYAGDTTAQNRLNKPGFGG